MIDYPFIKCLHPLRIINPYTHETMNVPCGYCEACRMNKHQRYTFLCKLESVTSGVPLFVTLTYRNSSIPRAQFAESIEEIGAYDLYDEQTGEKLNETTISDSEKELLSAKFHLFGACPYLRKIDLVNFLKRLRYYVTKDYPQAKLRYYACGEYGPVHFRPHYHLLLWLDDKQAKSKLDEYISQAWPHGRIDCQLSQGNSARYVAGYVNSFSNVPQVLKESSTCPFVLHSIRLGQGFLQGKRKKIYESSPREIIRQSLPVDGRNVEFNLWRSAYAYFFPKCYGFNCSNSNRLFRTYTSYKYLSELFETKAIKEIAEMTTLIAIGLNSKEHSLPMFLCNYSIDAIKDDHLTNLINIITENEIPDALENGEEPFRRMVTKACRILTLSRHFLNFVCDTPDGKDFPTLSEIDRKIKVIQEFYKTLEYMNLTKFYESQKLIYEDEINNGSSEDNIDDILRPYFYDNYKVDFTLLPIYTRFKQDVLQEYNNSIKHKKLNDYNKLLFND